MRSHRVNLIKNLVTFSTLFVVAILLEKLSAVASNILLNLVIYSYIHKRISPLKFMELKMTIHLRHLAEHNRTVLIGLCK